MSEREPTCIGRVKHVLGSTVTVALDPEMAGISPIFRGEVVSVGQIGSVVRIPQGLVDLIGSVSLVGIAELVGSLAPSNEVVVGERWLQVQLVGQIDRTTGQFQRGVGCYPGLDDAVHFATAEQLLPLFPAEDDKRLRVGRLAAAEGLTVSLDAARLVVRHAAIVGSTGSGKTSCVASLLQGFVAGGWVSSNIVVVDPHGEYSKALGTHARVLSVLGSDTGTLHVPFWALPAIEILRIFAGGIGGATFSGKFVELVGRYRRKFVTDSQWLSIDANAVTPDTPVPFDIKQVWFELDSENRETLNAKGDPTSGAVVQMGSAATLKSTEFVPYNLGSAAPFKGQMYGAYGTMPDLLRLGLKDPRLQFLLNPAATLEGPDPMLQAVSEWLGRDKPIAVLDFAGVPPEAADAAIGVVLNLILHLAMRGAEADGAVGRGLPVLLVLEEAHRYLNDGASALTRDAANKVAREGRKYGVGMWLVSQRPTELPDTALAQCGTLIALRLTNSSDQGTVKAALPDDVSVLSAILPALRTGEAIISGEAAVIPTRTVLDMPNPLPRAEDPSLTGWRRQPKVIDVAQALASWRGTYGED